MKKNTGSAIVLVLFVWGLAGALFGSLFAGLHQVLQVVGLEEISMFVLAAGVVALVGGLFQLSSRWIVATSSGWCPRAISASVVAGLIAAVVGASVWIMGGTTAAALDPATKGAIDGVIRQIPSGFFGGMLGGAVTGVLL